MEYILTSLDMIAGITDNLINYAFNVSFLQYMLLAVSDWNSLIFPQMASYDMNETMRV